jgi:methionine-rich copper-binding protein CopC
MRRILALWSVMGIVVLVVLGAAAPASAHDEIVSTTPAANQTLTALPAQFTITTNTALLDVSGTGRGFAFEIQDAAGKFYETGCVSIVDDSMFTTARLGAAGSYTIIFQLVSGDGHTVSGEVPFTWAPAAAATVTKGVSSPPGCDGAKGPAKPNASGGSEVTRDSQVPLADVLWIAGILLVVATAVLVTLAIVTRRRR